MGEAPVEYKVFKADAEQWPSAQRKLPKYRSHKIVHALKLQAVDSGPGETTQFVPADANYKPQVFPDTAEVVKRCRAREMRDPGYIVVYPDGFISWSPTEAFENSYIRVDEKGTQMDENEIARVCHEVNRAYCQALGDNSQLPWTDAPQWQKDSALAGVHMHLANPDAGPDDSHNSWLAQKEAEGWKYGAVKDPEKKEHPCFVPYNDLPTEQKAKDYIFRAVVHALKG